MCHYVVISAGAGTARISPEVIWLEAVPLESQMPADVASALLFHPSSLHEKSTLPSACPPRPRGALLGIAPGRARSGVLAGRRRTHRAGGHARSSTLPPLLVGRK